MNGKQLTQSYTMAIQGGGVDNMPTVAIASGDGNHDLKTLLAGHYAAQLGFGQVSLQTDKDGLKVGGIGMTSSSYDYMIFPDNPPVDEGYIMLQTRYVRNDSGVTINLNINVSHVRRGV